MSSFSKRLISEIYKALIHVLLTLSLNSVCGEKDLELEIEDTHWSKICNSLFSKCTSLSVHELNYKYINSFLHP